MIRVLVLGDVRLYRDGLEHVLGNLAHIDVVATAADLDEAMPFLSASAADIVLTDMVMPRSADIVRTITAEVPRVRVVALAVPEREQEVLACAEAGAVGYVPRDASIQDLVAVIESVAKGELLCSPRIAATLVRRVATLARELQLRPIESRLTRRELEILGLVEEGLTNKEIAARLTIGVSTVKNHVHSILEKLDVGRRTEAAARARRHGLVPVTHFSTPRDPVPSA